MAVKHVRTSVLDIAYQESGGGPADGVPVILIGFPRAVAFGKLISELLWAFERHAA